MQATFKSATLETIEASASVVFVDKKSADEKNVADAAELEECGFFKEGVESRYVGSSRTLYVKLKEFEAEEIKHAASKMCAALKDYSFESIKIASPVEASLFAPAFFEGATLGSYTFEKYKSEKSETKLNTLFIAKEGESEAKINALLAQSAIVSKNVNFVRDLVNSAPDDATPTEVAQIAANVAKELGFDCEIMDEEFLQKESMGAFLAVARASKHPPRLVKLSYKPKNGFENVKKVVLIGKGLTYDSGGLSLKPSDYMVTMKADKAGACAVIGAMAAAVELGLNVEIEGFLGLCENMIGGNAYKPDDVLVAKNSKTIEVRNTDAEGRLVLADVLCYAQESLKSSGFDYMIDMATLTGACVVALGEYTSGVMGHSEDFKTAILSCADKAGDLMAPLPFNKHLRKLIKSEIADIANCSSSRYGGAITAAMFLDEFVEEENKQKWVHLDIAGPAYVEKNWGYNPHGASGAPVRTIVEFLKSL